MLSNGESIATESERQIVWGHISIVKEICRAIKFAFASQLRIPSSLRGGYVDSVSRENLSQAVGCGAPLSSLSARPIQGSGRIAFTQSAYDGMKPRCRLGRRHCFLFPASEPYVTLPSHTAQAGSTGRAEAPLPAVDGQDPSLRGVDRGKTGVVTECSSGSRGVGDFSSESCGALRCALR
jgi:hypothetical protein